MKSIETNNDGTAVFKLVVSNLGPDAALGPITATDELPAGLDYTTATGDGWECAKSTEGATCTHNGDIAAGVDAAPILITTTYNKNTTATLINKAKVSSNWTETAITNNADDATLEIKGKTVATTPLAFTGTQTLLLLSVAAILMLAGTAFTRTSRRKQASSN